MSRSSCEPHPSHASAGGYTSRQHSRARRSPRASAVSHASQQQQRLVRWVRATRSACVREHRVHDASRAHVKKCTAGKKSQSMMKKPRRRAAKKRNDSDLGMQNRSDIANGISLSGKTKLLATCRALSGFAQAEGRNRRRSGLSVARSHPGNGQIDCQCTHQG